jgi:hypothetical protein
MLVCTDGDPPVIREPLWQLVEILQKNSRDTDEAKFRRDLEDLANNREPSLLSTGLYSAKPSERVETRLIRGNSYDYTLTEFSAIGYRPNLTWTITLLVNAVTDKLDSTYFKLLYECLAAILHYYGDRELNLANNQVRAFAMLEYILEVMAKNGNLIKRSPGRRIA